MKRIILSSALLLCAFTVVNANIVAYYSFQDKGPREKLSPPEVINAQENSNEISLKPNPEAEIFFSNDVPGKRILANGEVVNGSNTAALRDKWLERIPALVTDGRCFEQESFTVEAFVKINQTIPWPDLLSKEREDWMVSWSFHLTDKQGTARSHFDIMMQGDETRQGCGWYIQSSSKIMDQK